MSATQTHSTATVLGSKPSPELDNALRVDGVLPDLASPDVVDEHRPAQFEMIVWREGGAGVYHQIRRGPQVTRDRLPAPRPALGTTVCVHPRQVVRVDVRVVRSDQRGNFDVGVMVIPDHAE